MEIIVPGMSCGPCARAVTNAVQSVDPAAAVEIDLSTKRVAIATTAEAERVCSAIEQAGYKVDTPAA